MSDFYTGKPLYTYSLPGGSHWSLRVRRGLSLRLTDLEGGANLGALFYNPEDLLERYNAPDTLKCQHTFKLTAGHCLYSDMGRIFCAIVEDSAGWHDTVCGNLTQAKADEKYGPHSYQEFRNDWTRGGYESFLVELAKYGMGPKDVAANLNFFSRVDTDTAGDLCFQPQSGEAGDQVTLRFEMDTLVLFHTCPHPLNPAKEYPRKPVRIDFFRSLPMQDDDLCLNSRPENARGYANNRLYHFGATIGETGGLL